MKYKFVKWEDNSTNPKRTINIKANTNIIAYYEEVTPTRKGLSSSSSPVDVIVHPTASGEPTTLTMACDKAECQSGDVITFSGTLKFQSDGVPLENRNVNIYENGAPIASAVTGADGSYNYAHIAPMVTVDVTYHYVAGFLGDDA